MRLMEELLCSVEVRVRAEVRVEYSQFLKELGERVVLQHAWEMQDLRSSIEEKMRELALHPCCSWCVYSNLEPMLSAHFK